MLAAVCSVLLAAAGTRDASAYTSTQYDGITEHLYRGAQVDPAGVPGCGSVCSDLWLEEHRNIPNQATSQALHDDLRLLRRRALLTRAFSGFTTVAMGATAFGVGWTVGTGIRKMFFHDSIPAANYAPSKGGSDARIVPVDRGATIIPASSGHYAAVKAPSDGYLLQYFGGPNNPVTDVRGMPQSCNAVANSWRGNVPNGFTEVSVIDDSPPAGDNCLIWNPQTGTNNVEAVAFRKTVMFMSAGKLDATGGATNDYTGQSLTGGNNTNPLTNPGTATTKAKVTDELTNHAVDYPMLKKVYDHKFDPVANPNDPLVDTAVMPSCIGLSYNACLTAVQAAGFGVSHRVTLSFAAATPLPQAQAAQVMSTAPVAAAVADKTTDVTITTNPDDADMPRLVPAPLARETYDAYEDRLAGLGLTMAAPHVLSEELGDPERGPNEVTAVSPQPESRAHNGDAVAPNVNPPDWPVPAATGGGSCDTSIRGFDLSPLNVSLGAVFPFGVFGWLASALGSWGAAASAPIWHLKLTEDIDWTVSFAFLEPVMTTVRPVILILSALGIIWMLSASALGIARGSEE